MSDFGVNVEDDDLFSESMKNFQSFNQYLWKVKLKYFLIVLCQMGGKLLRRRHNEIDMGAVSITRRTSHEFITKNNHKFNSSRERSECGMCYTAPT